MNKEKNGESEPQKELVEKPKLNEEQYKLLLSCSKNKDIKPWNKYRKEHPKEKIWLQGAYLKKANLQGANLSEANLKDANLLEANLKDTNLLEANLEGAGLLAANLKSASLSKANLQGVFLPATNLQGANLLEANMQGANLSEANLKDANLSGANLEGADLSKANLKGAGLLAANLKSANLLEANLEGADFPDANLQGASLPKANLQGAFLPATNLQGTDLSEANMQGANLEEANLQGALLYETNLKGVYLWAANLKDANLWEANLEDANLPGANLQGTTLRNAKLHGADFTTAIVDGGTLIWECEVNRYSKSESFTNFEGVGLDSIRIDPETKQLLEYNIRRKNWEEWYDGKSEYKWIVRTRRLVTSSIRLFWSISDYGLSTGRIILSFILLVVIFATIYFVWGWADYSLLGIKDEPGIVKNLFIAPQAQQQISDVYYCLMIYFRSVCFSVATMFSFGDISVVNTQLVWKWWFSHLIPIMQMVTGYMLLGALVTRFAVLFTAGGPAGRFTKSELKEKTR